MLHQCHEVFRMNILSARSVNIHLFMPLQKDRAAIFRRPLEAFVDVFHQQVHAVPVQRLHAFLNVTALKGREHLQHQTFCTILQIENS